MQAGVWRLVYVGPKGSCGTSRGSYASYAWRLGWARLYAVQDPVVVKVEPGTPPKRDDMMDFIMEIFASSDEEEPPTKSRRLKLFF